MRVLGVAVAGAIGALARYGLDTAVSRRVGTTFPWGTLVVNVSGALLAGVLFGALADRVHVAGWVRPTLAVGFLGAYTTFSTLSLQAYRLFEVGSSVLAVAYAVGSLVAGLVAVAGGVVVGRAI